MSERAVLALESDECDRAPPLRISHLETRIGDQIIHENLELEVERGEILGLVGGSGSGKSVLLRSIIGLSQPFAGTIEVFGHDICAASEAEMREIEQHWGVLFQGNALFSSLTVLENIAAPLRELAMLPEPLCDELAQMKMLMAGLPPEDACKMPAQLSGGMSKRAALARAIVHDPKLLLLDEPTAGLDPIMAGQIDELVESLAKSLGLTVLLITHDLDTLYAICDRVAVLVDRRIAAVAPLCELEHSDHPWIREYLLGPRTRASGRS